MLFFRVFVGSRPRPFTLSLKGLVSAKPLRSRRLCVRLAPQHSNLQPANRSSVAVAERRSRSGRDTSTWLDSKSFPLNSFVDPHPLTPVASILYKNMGGQGVPRSAISCPHFASTSPLAATLMDLPASVANKRLTARAKPFRCNTYKKPGGRGIVPILVRPEHSRRVNYRRGEMGTGARGAPVPEVGLYVKIKRAQFRSQESHPNEGHVNSP